MKIYTKTGDAGTTGLFGGPRVSKNDPRIEAYGSVDELNAILGVARSVGLSSTQDDLLCEVQNALFAIGAELATPDPEKHGLKWESTADVQHLEEWIDRVDPTLAPLSNFVLPGGSPAAAHLHLARTVCRRVEREIVTLRNDPRVSDVAHIIIYLNRLSDLLFVMARQANSHLGVSDVPWKGVRREA